MTAEGELRDGVAPWRLRRGAMVGEDGAVGFSVWAPRAQGVEVVDARTGRASSLRPAAGGLFQGSSPFVGPGGDYWYRIDGGPLRPDPVSHYRPEGVHGPTRVLPAEPFRWTDGGWRGVPLRDLVLYELHVGTFTAAGTFDGVIERLPYLRDLGVTALELMPVAEFPGARNWGYDGVSLYAPQSSYGGPDSLRRLVDAAHATGLAVVLDVVYNHLGPEGNYLADFGPYFSDRHVTLWGQAWNVDGPDSDEVRRYLVDNALSWITEYHLDGLRLDAADRIVDFSARHLLEELAASVHAAAAQLGRTVHLIAESDANDPRFVRPAERGGYGLDAQWLDDFHHAVHAWLTGERGGYYSSFGAPGQIAKAMRDRFVFDGTYSPYRRRRHGAPARDVPAERFVAFIQNHDQVGNRAQGDRLASLVGAEQLRLAAALAVLSPFLPMLFMGEEFAETRPFLYFVDHGDAELCRAVTEGRRREFAAFGWKGEVPDPVALSSFEASRLDWRKLDDEAHRAHLELYRDLLQLRRRMRGADPDAEATVAQAASGGWVMLAWKGRLDAGWAVVFNLTAEAFRVPLSRGAAWRLELSTDDPEYGGSGGAALSGSDLLLPPWTAIVAVGATAGD
jgi:maltooligosyltrehalose trehalohydrolase